MADLLNLARQQTLTTGPGTLTLGPVVTGFISWAAAGAVDGRTYTYGIEQGNQREIGRGVYTAATNELTRNVLNSTNGGSPIELDGSAQVVCLPAAEDFTDLIVDHVGEDDPHPQYLISEPAQTSGNFNTTLGEGVFSGYADTTLFTINSTRWSEIDFRVNGELVGVVYAANENTDNRGLVVGGATANDDLLLQGRNLWWNNHKVITTEQVRYLEADTIFYVDAATGSDETGDGSVDNPWATAQYAVDWISANVHSAGYAVTLNLGNGAHPQIKVYPMILYPDRSEDKYVIAGNGPDSTQASFAFRPGSSAKIQDLELYDTGDGLNLFVVDGEVSLGANIRFAASSWGQVYMWGGRLRIYNNYTIAGSADVHIYVDNDAILTMDGINVTFSGAISFVDYFLELDRFAKAEVNCTFTGSFTGGTYTRLFSSDLRLRGSAIPGSGSSRIDLTDFEYGTNANGEYLRLADGTQIAWTNVSISNTAGVNDSRSHTFPAAFAVAPRAIAGLRGTISPLDYFIGVNNATTTGIDVVTHRVSTSGSGATQGFYEAIGRWR